MMEHKERAEQKVNPEFKGPLMTASYQNKLVRGLVLQQIPPDFTLACFVTVGMAHSYLSFSSLSMAPVSLATAASGR